MHPADLIDNIRTPAQTSPWKTTDLPTLAALPVAARLEAFGPLPDALLALLREGAVRLLDSDMIIRQRRLRDVALPEVEEGASTELRHDESALAEAVLEQIAQQGLADHFKPFMRSFIRIMFALFFTPEQSERACACLDDGYHFSFLMSDAGGPTLAGWRSVARNEQGHIRLTVDKVWGIEAHREGMAVIAARLPGVFFPAAYLVWPEQYRSLRRVSYGEPFLDGRLQLGNVNGEVEVGAGDRLKIGGPTVFNKYLTIVRPFFVRALMAHLEWLAREGRVTLDEKAGEAMRFIADAARQQTRSQVYSFGSVQRVLALKFASNELLSGLVRSGAVREFSDERDLLAFSKMEGSSYRCYHELRTSFKGA
ncbi:hypothetical protein [Trinickia sp. EG282A]|uniref:hypothetical protein n=1 Tax=Trinickia sp. EG282A TaxID=3237013 RepID=UPI0034D35581